MRAGRARSRQLAQRRGRGHGRQRGGPLRTHQVRQDSEPAPDEHPLSRYPDEQIRDPDDPTLKPALNLEEEDAYVLFRVNDDRIAPVMVQLSVAGTNIEMEVDTGAGISLMSEATYSKLWPNNSPTLQKTEVRLRTYTGEPVVIVGVAHVRVDYKGQREQLKLHVVQGAGPSLLGHDWLAKLVIDLGRLNKLSTSPSIEAVLTRYKGIFENKLGTFNGSTAKLRIDPQAQPIFCKAHSLPYSQKDKVEQELKRLMGLGVTEPVEFSDWRSQGQARWKCSHMWGFQTHSKQGGYLRPLPSAKNRGYFCEAFWGEIFLQARPSRRIPTNSFG